MLRILDQQMEALRQNAMELYEERLEERLRRESPEAVRDLDDGALRSRIRDEIARARAEGVTAEHAVTQRVEHRIRFGPAAEVPAPPEQASPREQRRAAAAPERPREAGSPVQPCLGWLEILLVDDDGHPIPDERYSVKLPDGTTKEGILDGGGRAYLVGIQPGTCQVSFPDSDVEKA